MPADDPLAGRAGGTGRAEVRLLGAIEVLVDGEPVPLRRGRQQILVAALALRPREAVSADRLIEELWPGELPEHPANALQHLVAQVRRSLGAARNRLVTGSSGYRLDIADADTDLGRIRAAAEAARRLLAAGRPADAADALAPAVARWPGDPLTEVRDGPLAEQAAGLREVVAGVEILAADVALALGTADAIDRATERLARLAPAHPLHESLWERRIALLARSGRAGEALAAYESVRGRLADELGTDPGPGLRALHAQLLAGDLPPRPDAAPSRTARSPLPPLPATRLFGREPDLATLAGLLARDDVRLVTVVGTSGIGKTRLALEHAHRSDRPVTVVLLDALGEGGDVAAAVAATLMLREIGTRDLPDVLADALPAGSLLVLDNAEHVLGRVTELVGGLLARRPEVAVLATSQWPLGLPGEHLLRLDVPAGDGADLLLDRAAHARPALAAPTPAHRAEAATIAGLLDGLPLAVELAAAQAGQLTLAQLATALEQSLDLLDRETLRHQPRHRRLADAVDWSLRLLTPQQRHVLTHCSVLSGPFDAALAAAVTARPESECLVTLLDLADRSVVHTVPPLPDRPGVRFCFLRPVREHARRHLERDGHARIAADRLLDRVVELAEHGDDGIRGRDQLAWLARLDDARADIETALDHALATGRVADAARTVAAIGRYWDWRCRLRDIERWTSAVMSAVRPEDAGDTARYGAVLSWHAFVAVERRDLAGAVQLATRGLAAAEAADDLDGRLTSMATLSLAPRTDLPHAAAAAILRRARKLAAEHGDAWGEAWTINRSGFLRLEVGDLDRAAADAAESGRRFAALGDARAVNWARHLEAAVRHAGDDRDAARRVASDVLTTAEALGDLRTVGRVAALLARLADDGRSRAELEHLSAGLDAERVAARPGPQHVTPAWPRG